MIFSGLFRVFYFSRLPFCLYLSLLASSGLLFSLSIAVDSRVCFDLLCGCMLCESVLYFSFFCDQRTGYRLLCSHFLAFPFSFVQLISSEIIASLFVLHILDIFPLLLEVTAPNVHTVNRVEFATVDLFSHLCKHAF